MDQQLQHLVRALGEAPGDPELREALLSSLERLAPESAAPWRDDLIGAYYACEALSTRPPERRLAPPRLRRLGRGLAPRPPRALDVRWRADGLLLHLGHALTLIEAPDAALEARRTDTGEVLWRVPSQVPLELLEREDTRVERLPWCVAPWGAVEVVAIFEAPLQYRRVGRPHPQLGRVTHREAVGRELHEVSVRSHFALPAAGQRWSAEPPRALHEFARSEGESLELQGGELFLQTWEDELLGLELDPREATFALFAGDEEREGLLYEVAGDPPALNALHYTLSPGQEICSPSLGRSVLGDLHLHDKAREASGQDAEALALDALLGGGEAASVWSTDALVEVLDGYPVTSWNAPRRGYGDAALFALDGAVIASIAMDSIVALG